MKPPWSSVEQEMIPAARPPSGRAGQRRPPVWRVLGGAVIALGLLGGASLALACKSRPDPRALHERVADAPVVFIGTVTAVRGGLAVWRVERALQGVDGRRFELPLGASSCDLRFRVGERWFYAGPTQLDASQLLERGDRLPAEVRALFEAAGR